MLRKFLFLLPCILLFSVALKAQEPENKGVVFARIYTGFYHNFNEDVKPQRGFSFATGILGYRKKLSENVSGIILYDVTRTTHFPAQDTISGFFEGSKYTAFLKMAQIDWKFHPKFKLSVGQLLNEQYLTVQDKWWGFRYVEVSMQEKFRFAMPADFGARLTYSPGENLQLSYTVVNGEGPFRYQDDEGGLLQSLNIQYQPVKNMMLKAYLGLEDAGGDSDLANKSFLSLFLGYKDKQWMSGVEYSNIDLMNQPDFNLLEGWSFYSSRAISEKLKILVRLDWVDPDGSGEQDYNYYVLGGIEYQAVKNLGCAITYRMNDFEQEGVDLPQLHANFGLKF